MRKPEQTDGARERSAGVSPAVPGASRSGGTRVRSRGRLPHIERENAIYFVTFRLADSLPATLLARWREERQHSGRMAKREACKLRPEERWQVARMRRKLIEAALDKAGGKCWLARVEIAEIVTQALKRFHGERYILGPWCVMPNHVHVLLRPLTDHSLAGILHSWKSFTAKKANRVLARRGRFWQREYYDHVVRSVNELEQCASYILSNPARASLADWQWLGEGDLEELLKT